MGRDMVPLLLRRHMPLGIHHHNQGTNSQDNNRGCYINRCIKHSSHQWVILRTTLREHLGNPLKVEAHHTEQIWGTSSTLSRAHLGGTGKK